MQQHPAWQQRFCCYHEHKTRAGFVVMRPSALGHASSDQQGDHLGAMLCWRGCRWPHWHSRPQSHRSSIDSAGEVSCDAAIICAAVMAAGRQISLHMSVTDALCAASPVCVQATSSTLLRVCSYNGSRVQSCSRLSCTAHYLGRADCISILCLRSFFGTPTLHFVPSFSLSNTPFHSPERASAGHCRHS